MPEPAPLILAALQASEWPRTVAALAATTGLRQRTVVRTLERLTTEGAIQRVRRGVFAAHR